MILLERIYDRPNWKFVWTLLYNQEYNNGNSPLNLLENNYSTRTSISQKNAFGSVLYESFGIELVLWDVTLRYLRWWWYISNGPLTNFSEIWIKMEKFSLQDNVFQNLQYVAKCVKFVDPSDIRRSYTKTDSSSINHSIIVLSGTLLVTQLDVGVFTPGGQAAGPRLCGMHIFETAERIYSVRSSME